MKTGTAVAYTVLGLGVGIGGYFWYKSMNPDDIITDTDITWIFPKAGAWSKHLPDDFTGAVVLDNIIDTVPPIDGIPGYGYAVQSVSWFNIGTEVWDFWGPGAPGTTLATLVAGEDYLIMVAQACEWTIPLV